MPKLKRLLVSARFEVAQRRRRCARNRRHEICQGDKCLVIKENMVKHNYCMECAVLIIQKAQEELVQLEKELDSGLTSATEQKGKIHMKLSSHRPSKLEKDHCRNG